MTKLELLKLQCEQLDRTREDILYLVNYGELERSDLENHDDIAGDYFFELHCVEQVQARIEADYDQDNPNGLRYLTDDEYQIYQEYLA